MPATYTERRSIADARFGSGTPATRYLMLLKMLPGPDGVGAVEVSGGSYARVAVANNTTNFPAAQVAGEKVTKASGAKLTFPNPTADWGKVVGYAWADAATGGAIAYFDPIEELLVRSGNTPVEFDVGQLVMEW